MHLTFVVPYINLWRQPHWNMVTPLNFGEYSTVIVVRYVYVTCIYRNHSYAVFHAVVQLSYIAIASLKSFSQWVLLPSQSNSCLQPFSCSNLAYTCAIDTEVWFQITVQHKIFLLLMSSPLLYVDHYNFITITIYELLLMRHQKVGPYPRNSSISNAVNGPSCTWLSWHS